MKLLVIDGNSIVNRAFFGIRPLSNKEGFPTQAIFGFLNILRRMVDEVDPDGLCITFDRKEPTFRHLAYAGYKAQRKKMPEELAVQIPMLKQVLDAMNIPCYELAGWEADDLIGTISRKCEAAGWDCRIATGDKDSLQLITPHTYVELVTTRSGKTTTKEMDPDTFREEYGFDPIHIIDLKALMGDASDNIPGVKGVGEKTAMGLVQMYGSIDQLYDHLPAVVTAPDTPAKPAMVKKLTEGRESAFQSYELCTIRCDAPLDFHPEDALRKPVNAGPLRGLLEKLELYKLITQLGLDTVHAPETQETAPTTTAEVIPLSTAEALAQALPRWEAAEHVTVLAQPGLTGVAVYLSAEGETLWTVEEAGYQGDYPALLAALFSEAVKKVAYGVKELCRALAERDLPYQGFCFDTELAAYLLDPTAGSYELRKLVQSYFTEDMAAEPTTSETWYADAAWVEALWGVLRPKLEELGLMGVLEQIELPLCPVLAEMEKQGMLVDQAALAQFGEKLRAEIAALETEIYEQAGETFNLNSTQQLGKILFEKLGLPPVKKTKTGYSTSAEVLEKLRPAHPMIDKLLEYRQLTKLNSTYVEGLARGIGPDGRIHTSFQNTVTATGRLSSTEPNLQNIPVRTPLGAQLRTMFIAPPDWVLVDADYSQIELRLLACISGDERMIQGFLSGEDVHTHTAAQVFGLSPEEVTPELRRRAKAVNFGIVYGISGFSLAQDIGVSQKEAKAYMEKYLETFAGVRAYMYNIKEQAKKDGYVATLMGRRRWLPELRSANFNMRSFGERVALNMPIQGTAADVMKLAMIRVAQALKDQGLEARLVLQVHDELIVECPQREAEQVKLLLEEEMEQVVKLAVPLTADAGVGRSWGEAKA